MAVHTCGLERACGGKRETAAGHVSPIYPISFRTTYRSKLPPCQFARRDPPDDIAGPTRAAHAEEELDSKMVGRQQIEEAAGAKSESSTIKCNGVIIV